LILSIISAISGLCFLNFFKVKQANLFLSSLVDLHTLFKLLLVITFYVTAMVSDKFNTACHIPPGMYTVSPGPYINSYISKFSLPSFFIISGNIFEK